MAVVFTREEIRKKLIRFIPWLLSIWFLYIAYSVFSKHMIAEFNSNPDSIYRFRFLRFLVRELAVYSFAFLTYFYFKRQGFDRSYSLQMLIILAGLDLVCLLLGIFRSALGDIEILYLFYNYLITILASPVYVICFVAYTAYFSIGDLSTEA